jgi:hypothetical protein
MLINPRVVFTFPRQGQLLLFLTSTVILLCKEACLLQLGEYPLYPAWGLGMRLLRATQARVLHAPRYTPAFLREKIVKKTQCESYCKMTAESCQQCCGSMTFWCGSGSGLTFKLPKQIIKTFFCLLLFEGTFTSFSKIKSQQEATKLWESRFFLLFLFYYSKK